MPPKKLLISGPGQGVAAASPVEPLLPDPSDALGEFQETTEIRRTAVVLVMPPEFAIERFLLRVHRRSGRPTRYQVGPTTEPYVRISRIRLFEKSLITAESTPQVGDS